MTKKQIGLRISNRTAEQMEQLKRIHSTATEVVAVAVNHYHDEMVMLGKAIDRIAVEFSEASLFGETDPDEEGIDVPTSVSNFQLSLGAYLIHDYPGATVTIRGSINDRALIDGQEDHPEAPWVDELINKCWNGDDWLVHTD